MSCIEFLQSLGEIWCEITVLKYEVLLFLFYAVHYNYRKRLSKFAFFLLNKLPNFKTVPSLIECLEF